jgi:hypothetical protein
MELNETPDSTLASENITAPVENTGNQPILIETEEMKIDEITETPGDHNFTNSENHHEPETAEIKTVESTEPDESTGKNAEPGLNENSIANEPENENEDHEATVISHQFEALSKAEMVKIAEEAIQKENIKEASEKLRGLRPAFENLLNEEKQKALAEFIEAGGERDDFNPPADELRNRFYATFDALKKKRDEQRVMIDKQKLINLEAKREILEKIKNIVESEESRDSLEQIKFLQAEWKRIRLIPQEYAQNLWDTYTFYIDKFYDNRSIFYELKELDRQKNLAAKIDLCLRVDELKNETSMKQCMLLLNKYHEDWKNIGPVPKQVSEELWQRFKAASDLVHDRYRKFLAELDVVHTLNLQKKRELLDRARELAQKPIEKGKEWNERTKEYEALLAEWKTIGMVPKEHNNIWESFRGIIDEFYKQKNNHFKELNKSRMENYRKKEALCLKAEALKDSTDWGKTGKELIKFQEEWKTIGPVPDKYNESIWKRFRAACDVFFKAKSEKFAAQKSEYATNLATKNEIIQKLEALSESEDYGSMMNEVRSLQEQWNATGFVAMNVKDELYKRYNAVLDKIYDKLRKNSSEFEQTQAKQRYEFIANQQDGKHKLQSEARRTQERIRALQENIDTLQNNIGFFANSKNAESLRKKVEEDIAGHMKQIKKLKEQLQLLRGIQNG